MDNSIYPHFRIVVINELKYFKILNRPMINSKIYITALYNFSICMSLLSFQIYNPLYVLSFQLSYFNLLSLY